MPPKLSPAEIKRRRGVRAAYFAGKPKPTPEPVPIKRVKPVEPSLVSIPAPTSSVIEQLPPSVSIETIEEWASADAKAHVYQASQNSTRPLGSKTTNPLPDKLPAQRKYFDQLGFVIRSERFQLSLAQNAEYVRFYRAYLDYWKEIQASKPAQSKVDNLQKLPVKMGKLRIPKDKRDVHTNARYYYDETTSAIGFTKEFATRKERQEWVDDSENKQFTLNMKGEKVYEGLFREESGKYFYDKITTTIIQECFDSEKSRQNYVDNPSNHCFTFNEDGSRKYKGTFRDTFPVIVDKIDPAQAKIYRTVEKLDKDRHTKTVDLKGVKLENTVDMQQHTPAVIRAYHALKETE